MQLKHIVKINIIVICKFLTNDGPMFIGGLNYLFEI